MPFKGFSRSRQALPEPFVDETTQPVFVLGSARSGTSAVRLVLESCAGFRGYREGHLANAIPLLVTQIERHYDEHAHVLDLDQQVLVANTDRDRMRRSIVDVFARQMVDLAPGERWLDKTPGGRMVRAAPFLADCFPRARFLYCIRRGIENIISRQRKFADVPFENQCIVWADAVQAWLEVKDALGDRGLVVRQHDLVRRPEEVAVSIRDVIGLSAAEGEAIARSFVESRPEQTGFNQNRFTALDETPWTEEQRATFVEKCGAEMELMGFSLEGASMDAAMPLRLFWAVAGDVVEVEGLSEADFTCDADGTLGVRLEGSVERRAIRYRDVPMAGHDHFTTSVAFSRECSSAVELSLSIEKDGEVVVSATTRADADQRLHVDWEALNGPHDVVIAMRPVATGPAFRVLWRDPVIALPAGP